MVSPSHHNLIEQDYEQFINSNCDVDVLFSVDINTSIGTRSDKGNLMKYSIQVLQFRKEALHALNT